MENKALNSYNTTSNAFPKPPLIKTPSILKELFIYNKYSRYIPIIKSHTAIERLYDELINPQSDHELIFLLETLEKIITNNPDVLSLLSPVNSDNKFFTTLIEVFLKHCDGSKLNHNILNIILRMCLVMTYNIIITKEQFKIVYTFITQNASLTSETTFKLFSLLEILCINSKFSNNKLINNELPKNYIVHNGEGEIVLSNGKELFEQNGKYLNICINFYIRKTGNDMCELFKRNEYPSSIFEINVNDGSVLKICLDNKYERMFCIYDASCKTNSTNESSSSALSMKEIFSLKEEIYWYTNLESNSWYSLRLCFNHNKNITTSHLTCTIITIPNHSNKDTSVYKTNIHTLEINKIVNMKLYKNFYGLSTSIIISDLKNENDIINMKPVEKFGIYNNKTFNNFNQANCNKASMKIISFSPHRFTIFDKGSKIILDDIYSNNNFQCSIINNKFNTRNDKELFFMFNLPHIYKNKLKNIAELGSVNQLLPIIEVFMRKKCLCNKNFIMFFNLVKIILFKNKMNLLNAISQNFFIALSIILESIDRKHFSIEIYAIIKDIYKYYLDNIDYILDKEKDIEKAISFPKLIFFNYALIKKFDSTIWKVIVNIIEAELDKFKSKRDTFANTKVTNIFIEKVFTLEGIIGILRDFDRFYPNKMCCMKHASFYGKQAITYKLESSYCLFENIFLKTLSIVFPYKNNIFTSLLRLTTMSFSPCLKKFILQVLRIFIQKDTSNINEFKTYCKRDEIAELFIYLISISDILMQYKLIYLFSVIFHIYPDIVTNNNFYLIVKNSLFLNNKRKCNYISKEFNSLIYQSDLESGNKQRSSSFERRDNDEKVLHMKNKPDIKSDMFYSQKKSIESSTSFKEREIINMSQIVSPNYVKEYADNKKVYLLQLFERFRSLFLINAELSKKNEVYIKQTNFLFSCLCLFVSRSNDLRILTLFGEAMKEMKTVNKQIYETFAYTSKDYLYLLFENYFHLKILKEQQYKNVCSVYIDNEKGVVSENTKKLIGNIIKTYLELLKCIFKEQNKLNIFYNFCTFNKLVYKTNSPLPYAQYITNFFYELFLHLLNETQPDLKEFSNINFYITFINLLFEFCFVFKHNYELITTQCNSKYSLDINPNSKLFTLPPFFAYWYNNEPGNKIEWNLSFVLIASFVEMSKSLWNFSETSSLTLNDINNQPEKLKQNYIDDLISKYVYPKEKTQYNYFTRLSYLCLTTENQKSFSVLKIIAFYYLSIFFSENHKERTQNKKEGVKLFIFLFSIIIMCSNINVEQQKKVEHVNKINDECLNVIIIVFGSLLQFYFETTNEALKHEFKEWFILTFHLINNILLHKKTRSKSTNPLVKLFKEILLNDKKKNILVEPSKFGIKLKTFGDMKGVIENEQFWKPFLENSNNEMKKYVNKFYQKDVVIHNCVKHFIIVKNLIPLNIQLYKYHSLDLDNIKEFELKVLTSYISVHNEGKSMNKAFKFLSQKHCEFEKKYLLEHSQQRRVFNYYQRIKIYKHIRTHIIRDLWDLSCYYKSQTYTVEHDELYAKLFHKTYNDSEYFQKFYIECIYYKKEKTYNGCLMVGDDGILFIGKHCVNHHMKCFFISFAKVTGIIKVIFKENSNHKGELPSLQILSGEHAKYPFKLNRHDLKTLNIMIKMNKQIQSNKDMKNISYKQ